DIGPSLISDAIITRVDVAVDVYGVNINDLHFTPKTPRRFQIWGAADGAVETLYLGSSKSVSYWRIYDKALESKLPGGIEGTRIERRLGVHNSIGELDCLANPLADLFVLELPAKAPAPMPHPLVWEFFKDSARLHGINAALAKLPKPLRITLREALKKS